jgi:transcriptional regulator with XRE-family HTH domain
MQPSTASAGPAGRHLAYRVASVVLDARKAIGWTQMELARRANTSQAAVSRLESGRIEEIDLGLVGRVLDAFHARVELTIDIPHLSDRRRQRDPAHARCVAFVRNRLAAIGWTVRTEVEIVAGRSQGWMDLFAQHGPTATVGVFEIKTDIDDAGRVERQIAWYEREAFATARRLGWESRGLVSAVLVLDTERAERRLRENRDILDHDFPVRASELLAWLTQPIADARPKGRALAMVDPLSRRRDWLRATVVDGRRRPSRYADYAEFMRKAARQRWQSRPTRR